MPREATRFVALFLSVTLLIQAPARASEGTVLIRSMNAAESDFHAIARARGFQTYSRYIADATIDPTPSRKLRELLDQAQEAWLGGSLEVARAHFERISELVLNIDWRPAQREALHYSLLRRAQISASPSEAEVWIEKAVAFAPDLEPEPGLFPPPLVARYKERRAGLLREGLVFRPATHFPNHGSIKINGKPYELTASLTLQLPKGSYRITALSESHEHYSGILETSKLHTFHFDGRPLAQGTCEAAGLAAADNLPRTVAILYGADCVRHFDGHTRVEGDTRDLLSPAPTVQAGESSSFSWPKTPPTAFAEGTIVKRKGWLIFGLSVLAVGAAALVARNQKRDSGPGPIEPVEREGF